MMGSWKIAGTDVKMESIESSWSGAGGQSFLVEGASVPVMMYPDIAAHQKWTLTFWTLDKTTYDSVITTLRSQSSFVLTDHYGNTYTVATLAESMSVKPIKAQPTPSEIGLGYAARHLHEITVKLEEVAS
jgi:hypothetical protein